MRTGKNRFLGFLARLAQPMEPVVVTPQVADQPYLPKVGKTYRIVGLEYRKPNIAKLAKENPNYKLDKNEIIKKGFVNQSVHQYIYADGPAELEQEPGNPVDPNAIKVIISGQHIGYIKAGSCAHLNAVINEGRLGEIYCRISGGAYKRVYMDVDDNTGKPIYCLEKGTDSLRAELRIIEK